MMFYYNTKVKVHSKDEDTDIVAEVFQGDTLEPYLVIIYLDYIIRTPIDLIKENGLTLKRARSKLYSAETMADAGYADNIAFFINTTTQTKLSSWRNG